MAVLLLPVSMVLLFGNVFLWLRKYKMGGTAKYPENQYSADFLPQAVATTACAWVLLLYAMTEFLSSVRKLNAAYMIGGWTIVCLFLLLALLWYWKLSYVRKREHRSACEGVRMILSRLPVGAAFLVCILSGYLAWKTVPYNWDSMAYHLARIPHWLQNQSVAHYATNIDRQVFSPTLAEFVMLHIYALCDGQDKLINYVQCGSLWITVYLVYAIAREIGCSGGAAGVAALLYASTPIAFAESLTTQVDLFSAVFGLIFVLQGTQLSCQRERLFSPDVKNRNFLQLLLMSMSLGFGYLSKPSVCLAMVFFLIPILIGCARRRDSVVLVLKCVVGCGLTAAIVAVPELLRMWGTYHAFTYSEAGAKQMVGTAVPSYVLVNFLKNFFFNLPNAYMPGLSDRMEHVLQRVSSALNVALDDPSISEGGRTFSFNAVREYGHDTAINPLIVWVWIAVCLWLVLRLFLRIVQMLQNSRRKDGAAMDSNQRIKRSAGRQYFAIASVSFLCFLAILRWEMFETRYEILYLALLCPSIVWAVCQPQNPMPADGSIKIRKVITGLVLAGTAGMCLLQTQKQFSYHENIAERQNERPRGYYWWWGAEYDAQSAICAEIREQSVRSLGLHCDGGYYEYPLWKQLDGTSVHIEHVLVDNTTAQYEDGSFLPDIILWTGSTLPEREDGRTDILTYHGQDYAVEYAYDDTHVILRRQI